MMRDRFIDIGSSSFVDPLSHERATTKEASLHFSIIAVHAVQEADHTARDHLSKKLQPTSKMRAIPQYGTYKVTGKHHVAVDQSIHLQIYPILIEAAHIRDRTELVSYLDTLKARIQNLTKIDGDISATPIPALTPPRSPKQLPDGAPRSASVHPVSQHNFAHGITIFTTWLRGKIPFVRNIF